MRIIYLHHYFNTPRMVGCTRSYETARWMVSQGHEVHVVTSDRVGRRRGWYETDVDGIHVHWHSICNSADGCYSRRLRAFFKFAWLAARKAASLPGDLVFATSPPLTLALPAVYAARKHRVPMVFEVCDLWPTVPIAMGILKRRPAIAAARWLERFAYRNASRIIALSPGMRDGVLATGYPEDRVALIPNLADIEFFGADESQGKQFRAQRPWLGGRPLVIYAGTLGVVNGVDYLARLAAAVLPRDPEVRFLVVGSDREEARIRRDAQHLNVYQRNFFMEPAKPKSEMPALFSAADISTNLIIDVKELAMNSANKMFDTLAAGRPLAVNQPDDWIAAMIRQTGCGLVLHPHDMNAAADTLLGAIRNPAWMDHARKAARRLAEERFSRDKLVQQWASVIISAAEDWKHRPQRVEASPTTRKAA